MKEGQTHKESLEQLEGDALPHDTKHTQYGAIF